MVSSAPTLMGRTARSSTPLALASAALASAALAIMADGEPGKTAVLKAQQWQREQHRPAHPRGHQRVRSYHVQQLPQPPQGDVRGAVTGDCIGKRCGVMCR